MDPTACRWLTTAALPLVLGFWLHGAAGVGRAADPDDETAPPIAAAPAAAPESTVFSTLDLGQETPRGPLTPAPAPDPYPNGPTSSRFLLGDAFGLHTVGENQGLEFFASSTQFEQGVASGGAQQAFRWGGKFDMLAHLDSERLGLWDGGFLDLFAESRLGVSVDGFAGALSPPNLAMYFPVPNQQITALTGLKYTQALNDRVGLFFGKLNALNGDRERFLKYPLTSRFWNAAFNFNLALDRYPYSALGAGFYATPERGPAVALLVLDSHSTPLTSGFENLGRNGAFFYGEAKQATHFFGLEGRQTLAGLYGLAQYMADPSPYLDLPQTATLAPRKAGTWTLLWNAEQRLWVDPDDPDRGLGLYLQTGLGDGNPNPVRWFASAALCGNSPIPGRPGDLFGAGFYEVGLSPEAKTLLPGLRDEPGVELFYNLRITPGCHLTPDLQVLKPGLGPLETCLLLGLRLKLDF